MSQENSSDFTVDQKRNVMNYLSRNSKHSSALKQQLKQLKRSYRGERSDSMSERETSSESEYENDSSESSSSYEPPDQPQRKSFKKHQQQGASEKNANNRQNASTKSNFVDSHQKMSRVYIPKDDVNKNSIDGVHEEICRMDDALSKLSKSVASLKHDVMVCQPYLEMSAKKRFTLQSLPSFPLGGDRTEFKSEANVVNLPIQTVDDVIKLNDILDDPVVYGEIVSFHTNFNCKFCFFKFTFGCNEN